MDKLYIKKKGGKRNRYEIDNAKKHVYVLAFDGASQFTIKAYHGVKRGERGGCLPSRS